MWNNNVHSKPVNYIIKRNPCPIARDLSKPYFRDVRTMWHTLFQRIAREASFNCILFNLFFVGVSIIEDHEFGSNTNLPHHIYYKQPDILCLTTQFRGMCSYSRIYSILRYPILYQWPKHLGNTLATKLVWTILLPFSKALSIISHCHEHAASKDIRREI